MMAPIFCSRHDIDKFKRTQCEYVLLMTGTRNVGDWQTMTENIFGIVKNRLFSAEVVKMVVAQDCFHLTFDSRNVHFTLI